MLDYRSLYPTYIDIYICMHGGSVGCCQTRRKRGETTSSRVLAGWASSIVERCLHASSEVLVVGAGRAIRTWLGGACCDSGTRGLGLLWFRPERIGLLWFRHERIGLLWFRHERIGLLWFRQERIGLPWFRHERIVACCGSGMRGLACCWLSAGVQ